MLIGTAILSIGIFNGVMLSVIMWINRKDRFLAFGIFIYCMLLLKYLGYWVGYFPDHVVFAQMLRPLELLMGPILLGAIFRLGGWHFRWELWHYLPFALLAVTISVYCLFQFYYFGEVMPFFPRVTMLGKVTHEFIYMLAIPFLYRKLNKGMVLISVFYVLHWILSICYSLFRFSGELEIINILLFAGMALSVNYLAFIALRSSILFEKPKIEPNPTFAKKEPELEPIFVEVRDRVESEALFLNSSLKVSDLASQLKISEKLISKAVNEVSGENFNSFINSFRVARAEELMKDPDFEHYTIDAIGLESGFANKVSFYKAFKRIHAISPSTWKRGNRSSLLNNLAI